VVSLLEVVINPSHKDIMWWKASHILELFTLPGKLKKLCAVIPDLGYQARL